MAVACEGALPLHSPVRQCAEPAHGRMLGRSQGVMFLQVCSTRRVNESMEAWRCYVAARHVVTHHVHAPRCRMHGSWTYDTSEFAHRAASKATVKGRQPPCRFCKGGTIGIASGSLVRVATPMVPRTSCARTRFCLRLILGLGQAWHARTSPRRNSEGRTPATHPPCTTHKARHAYTKASHADKYRGRCGRPPWALTFSCTQAAAHTRRSAARAQTKARYRLRRPNISLHS